LENPQRVIVTDATALVPKSERKAGFVW